MAFSQPLFQVIGTAIKPNYSTGASSFGTQLGSGATVNATVDSLVGTGIFGSSVVDYSTVSGARALVYGMSGGDAPTTGAFSFLIRIVPKWTGTPSTYQALFEIGDLFIGPGVCMGISTAGKINFECTVNGALVGFSLTTTAVASFTSGTPTDLMGTWDGTASANSVKIYQDGVLLEQDTPTRAYGSWAQGAIQTLYLGRNYHSTSGNVNYTVNEFDIFNSAQAAYSVRSGFITSSNLNGDTIPGASDVRSGVITGLNTGTCVVPTAANVRSGTSVDATTGTLAVPTPAQVLNGVSTDNTTGTYVTTATTDVRHGTTFGAASALTGTAFIPTAANVRSGTNVDATTGTLAVPTPAQVLVGVSTDNTVGTYTGPATSTVQVGVTYGAALALTGTYTGSDRWSDPGAANVRSGTAYKVNSTSNNTTGTAAIPAAGNVRLGTATDATTGTLAVPTPAQVLNGVSTDNTTGTYVAVATTNVRHGTAFGAASALTGTAYIPSAGDVRLGTNVDATTGTLAVPSAAQVLFGISVDNTTGTYVTVSVSNVLSGVTFGAASGLTGTLLSTDPGQSNVISGTTYSINSVSKTGTYVEPTISQVKHSVSFGGGTGTYTGSDLWSDPGIGNVVNGIEYLANGATLTGTFTSTSSDPGIANVRIGTHYEINGTNLVGTLYVNTPTQRLTFAGRISTSNNLSGKAGVSP